MIEGLSYFLVAVGLAVIVLVCYLWIRQKLCKHRYTLTMQDSRYYYHACNRCGKEIKLKKAGG